MTKRELQKFLKDFKYLNRQFTVKFNKNDATIEAQAVLKDVDTGKDEVFGDYRTVDYRNCNEFQMLVIMRNWMMILALHELDEHIQYQGQKVFDPHKTKNYLY